MPDEAPGRLSGPRPNPQILWCNLRKQERFRLKNVARQPGRYKPLSAAWKERGPVTQNPEAPRRDLSQLSHHCLARLVPETVALVRSLVVLVGPGGSRVLHGMRQRPPVFRYGERIGSIEPRLAERTSLKVIRLERSALQRENPSL